ncbi:MAG: TIGR02757 family protein [Candidatus Gastranaerophilales bacterium]|nr:TIGR02757 family protein [Candidatus Gastranaerophilales bacterium]
MNKNELKKYLDDLVIMYETKEFIHNDPIQFPHRFTKKQDIEISGLIASSLAFGKREKIIEAVEKVHQLIENEPYNFCTNFKTTDRKIFSEFKYRYINGENIADLIEGISKAIKKYDSLEDILTKYDSDEFVTIKEALTGFVDELLSCDNYLLPCPRKNSACKRLNLYLKWMIRKSQVDIGVWEKIDKSKLIIPLDVHVARVSRKLGLLERKANDWQSAYEITKILKEFDPKDPTKYDFALFGAGIGL